MVYCDDDLASIGNILTFINYMLTKYKGINKRKQMKEEKEGMEKRIVLFT